MSKLKNFFSQIYFSESFFEKILIKHSNIEIIVSNIGVIEKHPLYEKKNNESVFFLTDRFLLSFKEVTLSKRVIQEYVVKKGIRETLSAKEIIDISNFAKIKKKVYEFGGETLSPPAWIDWYIEAEYFEMQVYEV